MMTSEIPLLQFRLADQIYALFIDQVIEVAAMVQITPLSQSHPAILGIIDRHGTPLIMLDLRLVFGKPGSTVDAETLFIVAEHRGQQIGLVVDEVLQVEYATRLRAAPSGSDYLYGVVSQNMQLTQIIALEALIEGYLSGEIEV